MTKPAELSQNRSMLIAIGAGLISAGLTILTSVNIMFTLTSYFATLPLFYIGFSCGVRPLLIAAGVALGVITLLSITFTGSVLGSATYMFWNIFPVLWICNYSKLTNKNVHGDLIFQISLYSIALLILTRYLPGFGGDNMADLDAIKAALSATQAPNNQVESMMDMLRMLSPYLPGIMMASWLFMILSNWFLSKKIVSRLNSNETTTDISLNNGIVIILALLGTIGFLFSNESTGLLAINACIALIVPCFASGMSSINIIAKNKRISKLMVGLFYIFMLFFPILIIFVVLLGIFEPWLHIRSKFAKD